MITNTSPLLIWASGDEDAQTLASALKDIAMQSGEGRHAEHHKNIEAAAASLGNVQDAFLCMIYTAPELTFARALEQENTNLSDSILERAGHRWAKEAEAILTLYRANRHRCMIFETEDLLRFSETGLKRLSLETEKPLAPALSRRRGPNAPMLTLVAQSYITDQPALATLKDELLVSTQPLSNDSIKTIPMPSEEALTAYKAQFGPTLMSKVTNEQNLLAQQNAIMLSQMQVYEAKVSRLNKETEVRGQRIQALEAQLSLLSQDADARRRRIKTMESEMDRIMNSRSMRATRPLRAFFRLLGKKPDV